MKKLMMAAFLGLFFLGAGPAPADEVVIGVPAPPVVVVGPPHHYYHHRHWHHYHRHYYHDGGPVLIVHP
jgi:hypothetical protein